MWKNCGTVATSAEYLIQSGPCLYCKSEFFPNFFMCIEPSFVTWPNIGNFHWNPEDLAKSIVCMTMSGPFLTGYTQVILFLDC